MYLFFPLLSLEKVPRNSPIDYQQHPVDAYLQGFFIPMGSRRVAESNNTPTFSLNEKGANVFTTSAPQTKNLLAIAHSRCKVTK